MKSFVLMSYLFMYSIESDLIVLGDDDGVVDEAAHLQHDED